MRARHLLTMLLSLLVTGSCGGRSAIGVGTGNKSDGQVPRKDGPVWYKDGPAWRSDVRPLWVDGSPWPRPDLPVAKLKTCQFGCTTKADCVFSSPSIFVDCQNGLCIQCKTDADCASPPGIYKGGCNTVTGTCTMCKVDADCFIGGTKLMTGKCDSVIGICLKCSAASDCLFPGSPYKYCGPTATCTMCKVDADCPGTAGAMTGCDTGAGICSRCRASAECCQQTGGACGLSCDLPSGKCVCSTDLQCEQAYPSQPKLKCRGS